jgi:hypothetical protein
LLYTFLLSLFLLSSSYELLMACDCRGCFGSYKGKERQGLFPNGRFIEYSLCIGGNGSGVLLPKLCGN